MHLQQQQQQHIKGFKAPSVAKETSTSELSAVVSVAPDTGLH